MSILVDKSSKVAIQGFTGAEGSFHASQMIEYGTCIVGGVTPGKGGQTHLGRPVFNTVQEIVEQEGANVTVIFVPPAFAADSIMEAIEAGIGIIVAITEGIPVRDMTIVKKRAKEIGTVLIGPNCPGIITPEEAKVGIMPGFVFKKGSVGVISKSGTLTYESADQIVKSGMGISTAVGIGGDPIIGISTQDALAMFVDDPDTEAIVMIGEIGGSYEADAARWFRDKYVQKPVIGYIAGQTAPPGRRMGHAGAIISGAEDTAEAKMDIMRSCGIHVVDSPALIGEMTYRALHKN